MKTPSETVSNGGKMQLIFIRIKMSLVPQFLSILHHSAKIPLVNNSHAKFQGRTRNASFRSNQKSLQCKPAKNEKRTIDKKTTCSCNAIQLEIKFTLSNFYFTTHRSTRNTQELIGNTSRTFGGYY